MFENKSQNVNDFRPFVLVEQMQTWPNIIYSQNAWKHLANSDFVQSTAPLVYIKSKKKKKKRLPVELQVFSR